MTEIFNKVKVSYIYVVQPCDIHVSFTLQLTLTPVLHPTLKEFR